MKVDKIARLFLAQTGPAQFADDSEKVNQSESTDSEAVTVNAGLGGGEAASSDDAARAAKVARLKEAVNSNTYNPDSKAVAASVYKDLFI